MVHKREGSLEGRSQFKTDSDDPPKEAGSSKSAVETKEKVLASVDNRLFARSWCPVMDFKKV